ncbi:PucR family transcriptional regulator [Arthrobacter sp. AETb3-4]|uniref:PucR family transcriptional regulator n=2 Tax=Arthrobacter wenxiniae TaxID=2713570 RepID=A0A7Y7IF40_9MICC|nr:PucR family transcriptional regulator [Arthrobacter wenxiniae]
MNITVQGILDVPEIQVANPQILAGGDQLDNPVRWVHIAEVTDFSGLLQGGEMVLTTGLALDPPPGQEPSAEDSEERAQAYLRALDRAGVSGVIVELMAGRTNAVAALRSAAMHVRIPVIVVTQRVRFVEVTEVVHRLIVAEQLEQVEKARFVHEVFTELSLTGAAPEEIVTRAAEIIGAPIVLEDLSHLVVAYAPEGIPAQELLNDWERRSRRVPLRHQTLRSGTEDWLQSTVGLRGHPWGRLVVPIGLADDSAAHMVLERAGQALAINRMAERDQRELSQQAQAGLLHELRQGRSMEESEALVRAAAFGLRAAPLYVPAVIRLVRPHTPDPLVLQRQERSLLDLVNQTLQAKGMSGLVASLQTGSVAILLAIPARQPADPILQRLCRSLIDGAAGSLTALSWTVGIGESREALLTAARAGIDEANHVAETASTLRQSDRPMYRFADIRLRGLLALLRGDPRVQTFVEAELSGLLRRGDGGDLDLLQKYLESDGNKAGLARSGYLSRPTLYARLASLEKRLGVSLSDPESRTSLHVALLLYRLRNL